MGIFEQYRERGLVVVPERNGIPLVKWSKYYKPDDQGVIGVIGVSEAAAWDNMQRVNYGLVCGHASNVIGIDIDDDDIAEEVYRLAGQTLVRKYGSKGFTAFYKYSGESNKVWKRDGVVMVELLSNGRKTTIPPSQHNKSGKQYEWLDSPLLDIAANELPLLDEAFIKSIDSMFPCTKQQHVVPNYTYDKELEPIHMEEIDGLLGYLDPDMAYHEWVSVGMGLCSEFSDAAFPLWDAWSKSGSKYDPKVNLWGKWRSFHGGGVGIGTVVYMAKQSGWFSLAWQEAEKKHEPWMDIDISQYITSKKEEIKEWSVEKLVDKAGNVKWADNIPDGYLSTLSSWMTDSAMYPQAVLSIGNAIAALGALMGHRYQNEDGARTNMMVIGLAPSGSGKDHPIRCSQRMFNDCDLSKLIGGQPASGPGVISTVKKSGGRKLLQIDEIGRILASINSERAAGYEKQILTELMMIFSASNGVYTGREYANQDERPTITIDQPCLSIYGATVAENLYDSITSRDAIDGFLSRWLLFQAPEGYVDRVIDRKKLEVNEDILEIVQTLERQPTTDNPYGIGISPLSVAYSEDARKVFHDYWTEIDKRKKTANGLGAILARMPEHIAKLSLIVWCGSGSDEIRTDHVQWAIDVVEYCIANSVVIAREYITDGNFDKQTKRIHRYIGESGKDGISRTRLSKKFTNLKSRDLSESLTKLAESGLIKINRNGKKETYFAEE